MTFVHYATRPESITAEFIADEYEKLLARAAAADAAATADEWIRLISDRNALRAYLISEHSRINYRLYSNFSDENATVAEEFFREHMVPLLDGYEDVIVAMMLETPHRAALEARFGSYLFRRMELSLGPMAPINAELRLREGELQAQYGRLMASAEIVVDGETMTIDRADSLQVSSDRAKRIAAYVAVGDWLVSRRDEIATIFDELVHLRDTMGRNLGHDGFTQLGYDNMERTDYGPAETARFRKHVLKHFLPLARSLADDQAQRLGTPTLSITDGRYDPVRSLPRGVSAPVDTQLQRAARIFSSLSPRLGEHFDRMVRENLIDHANRPDKYSGAFCTPMYDENRCAVMLNSVGDANDAITLLHELGHAFQNWESTHIELVDQRNPTSDLAEIHSMTMELLGMRHIEELIPAEHATRYRLNAWSGAVRKLVGIVRMDEFQHWIYDNPNASIGERETKFAELNEEYSSGFDFSGYEAYSALTWYEVPHLFMSPFYMIDYALAQLVAMQLALIDANDHEGAMKTYLDLCSLGGTLSFAEAVAKAGLRLPFDEDVVAELAAHASREMQMATAVE